MDYSGKENDALTNQLMNYSGKENDALTNELMNYSGIEKRCPNKRANELFR